MTAKSSTTLKNQFQDVDPEVHNDDLVDSTEPIITSDATSDELNYVADVTAGTAAASKAAVLGSNKELDEVHAEALYLGSGAGTQIAATASQINKVAADGIVVVDKTQIDASGGGSGATTTLSALSEGDIILDVIAVVDTAFDGDTTTTLEVGVAANADKYIDTNDFDPSGSAGTSRSMLQRTTSGTAGSNDQTSVEYLTADTALLATWTNTASATAGAVTVYVQYADMTP